MTQQEDYLRPGEVAAILKVNPKTVTRWCRAGQVKGAVITPGGHYRIPRSTIDNLLANPITIDPRL